MPLASMSNVTSICGMPRGAAGIPVSWKRPSVLLSACHLALALQDVNLNGGLVIGRRGVHLGLARRDGGVAIDHLGHDATHGLDAQRKRSDVEQEDALDVAAEHAALDSRAHGNDLVRVDAPCADPCP